MPSSTDLATQYARSVRAGMIPAGHLHRLACERHLRDLDAAPASGFDWRWDLGSKVCRFFRLLRHFKGEHAGQPIVLSAWQIFIVASLFGWRRRADGRRRFRQAFIELPRGSGKSTLAAGIGVWLAFFDNEAGSDVYCVATKKDQARICVDAARHAVLRSPAIRRRGVTVSKFGLYAEATASKFEALGSDVDTLDGTRPSGVIVDEVHKLTSPALIETMQSGMGTRTQPLMLLITTAGDDTALVYGQHAQLAASVLQQDVELPDLFAFTAAADADDDWTREATWQKANPNYGVSVQPEFLRAEVAKALANPHEQQKVRRLYLGQHVGVEDRYLPAAAWAACARDVADADLVGRRCTFGLDISSKIDLSALVLLFEMDGGYAVRPFFWMPEATLAARERRDRVPYTAWRDQGYLRTLPGSVIDQQAIRHTVRDEAARWHPVAVAFDPWNASQLALELGDQDGLPVVEIRQGLLTLSEPTKRLAELVLGGQLAHGNHPLLNLHAANLRVKRDVNDNVVPDKAKAITRIDGMSALVTAVAAMLRQPVPVKSVYEREDFTPDMVWF